MSKSPSCHDEDNPRSNGSQRNPARMAEHDFDERDFHGQGRPSSGANDSDSRGRRPRREFEYGSENASRFHSRRESEIERATREGFTDMRSGHVETCALHSPAANYASAVNHLGIEQAANFFRNYIETGYPCGNPHFCDFKPSHLRHASKTDCRGISSTHTRFKNYIRDGSLDSGNYPSRRDPLYSARTARAVDYSYRVNKLNDSRWRTDGNSCDISMYTPTGGSRRMSKEASPSYRSQSYRREKSRQSLESQPSKSSSKIDDRPGTCAPPEKDSRDPSIYSSTCSITFGSENKISTSSCVSVSLNVCPSESQKSADSFPQPLPPILPSTGGQGSSKPVTSRSEVPETSKTGGKRTASLRKAPFKSTSKTGKTGGQQSGRRRASKSYNDTAKTGASGASGKPSGSTSKTIRRSAPMTGSNVDGRKLRNKAPSKADSRGAPMTGPYSDNFAKAGTYDENQLRDGSPRQGVGKLGKSDRYGKDSPRTGENDDNQLVSGSSSRTMENPPDLGLGYPMTTNPYSEEYSETGGYNENPLEYGPTPDQRLSNSAESDRNARDYPGTGAIDGNQLRPVFPTEALKQPSNLGLGYPIMTGPYPKDYPGTDENPLQYGSVDRGLVNPAKSGSYAKDFLKETGGYDERQRGPPKQGLGYSPDQGLGYSATDRDYPGTGGKDGSQPRPVYPTQALEYPVETGSQKASQKSPFLSEQKGTRVNDGNEFQHDTGSRTMGYPDEGTVRHEASTDSSRRKDYAKTGASEPRHVDGRIPEGSESTTKGIVGKVHSERTRFHFGRKESEQTKKNRERTSPSPSMVKRLPSGDRPGPVDKLGDRKESSSHPSRYPSGVGFVPKSTESPRKVSPPAQSRAPINRVSMFGEPSGGSPRSRPYSNRFADTSHLGGPKGLPAAPSPFPVSTAGSRGSPTARSVVPKEKYSPCESRRSSELVDYENSMFRSTAISNKCTYGGSDRDLDSSDFFLTTCNQLADNAAYQFPNSLLPCTEQNGQISGCADQNFAGANEFDVDEYDQVFNNRLAPGFQPFSENLTYSPQAPCQVSGSATRSTTNRPYESAEPVSGPSRGPEDNEKIALKQLTRLNPEFNEIGKTCKVDFNSSIDILEVCNSGSTGGGYKRTTLETRKLPKKPELTQEEIRELINCETQDVESARFLNLEGNKIYKKPCPKQQKAHMHIRNLVLSHDQKAETCVKEYGPMVEPDPEDISPEVAAAMLFNQEQGIQLESCPTETIKHLFPDDGAFSCDKIPGSKISVVDSSQKDQNELMEKSAGVPSEGVSDSAYTKTMKRKNEDAGSRKSCELDLNFGQGKREYVLVAQKPQRSNKIQFRGNAPSWFPGYYSAFPDHRGIKIQASPSEVFTKAWMTTNPENLPASDVTVVE